MTDCLLVCNNSTNEVEAYAPDGRMLYRKPTGVPVLDLLHEPRMAGSEAFLCFIEKAWQGVLVWPTSHDFFKIKIIGEPVVLAMHGQVLGVGVVDAMGQVRITIFLLPTKVQFATFAIKEAGIPDDMSFHPDGTMIIFSVHNTVAVYNFMGQRLSSFGKNILLSGHVSLGFDKDANLLAVDMTAKRLYIMNCSTGSVISSIHQGLVHPTAVAAFQDMIYVLDTGSGKLQTFTKH
jgi:DNA-binding beta-propeller fold protein YncE